MDLRGKSSTIRRVNSTLEQVEAVIPSPAEMSVVPPKQTIQPEPRWCAAFEISVVRRGR